MLSQDRLSQLNKARTVGGAPSVYLDNGELSFLLCIVCADLGITPPAIIHCEECQSRKGLRFYSIPIPDLRCEHLANDPFAESKLHQALNKLLQEESNLFTYFIALTCLHAQRRKYRAILDKQEIPELETVIPRGLIETGTMPSDELASWLLWRKFAYDIDNRAAQTTGYLFEPILAASIGGIPFSARKSPVRRGGKGRGRQVDCLVNKDAYEFKMRVTIAASGQGRFAEELSFAEDCELSGFRPILLVLDPTPSSRLNELSAQYREYGGAAYIGDSAWTHLENRAGKTMSQFLRQYVREPISRIDEAHCNLLPVSLDYDPENNIIQIIVGEHHMRLR